MIEPSHAIFRSRRVYGYQGTQGVILASILCATVVIGADAHAQIGLPQKNIEALYDAAPVEADRGRMEFTEIQPLELRTLSAGADGARVWVGIDPKTLRCCCIYGFRSEAGAVKGGLRDADAILKAVARPLTGELKRVRWRLHTGFSKVYPPLGEQSQLNWWSPITRATGVQSKMLSIDPLTGQVVGQTPWEDVRLETGDFNVTVKFKERSHEKFVLRTDDCALYAVIGSVRYRDRTVSTVAPTFAFGDGESEFLTDFLIADAATFWRIFLNRVQKTGDPYERDLKELFAKEHLPAVRRRRIASGLAVFADDAAFDSSQILDIEDQLAAADPEFRPLLEKELLGNIKSLSRRVQSRRLGLVGEVGSREAIAPLGQFMRGSTGKTKMGIRTTLRRIASRESLLAPPADDASALEWGRWIRTVGE